MRTELKESTLSGTRATSAVATGAMDFRVSEGEVSLAVSGRPAPIPVLFYPTVVLVRPPPSGASVPPPARPWIASTFSDVAVEEASRNFPDFIPELEITNPALVVSELSWGVVSATPTGRATVSGAGSTVYDVTIDLRRALARASGPARAPLSLALDSEISHLRDAGTATLAVHAWIDDTGRLVRADAAPPVPGLGMMSTTFSDFSQAVTLDPPSPEQVVNLSSLSPTGERENRNGGDSDGG